MLEKDREEFWNDVHKDVREKLKKAKDDVWNNLIADWMELNKKHKDGNKAFAEIGKLIRKKRHLSIFAEQKEHNTRLKKERVLDKK